MKNEQQTLAEKFPFTAGGRAFQAAKDHPLAGWFVFEEISKVRGIIEFVVDGVAIVRPQPIGNPPTMHRIPIPLADMTYGGRRMKLFPTPEAFNQYMRETYETEEA